MRIDLAQPERFTALLRERYGLEDTPTVTGISIDSRQVAPGDLFVALVGQRTDGHLYIPQAIKAGAVVTMVSRPTRNVPADGRTAGLKVKDTALELGYLAQAWRRLHTQPLIAITGSNGKTTTKDLAVAVLSRKFNVLGTRRSLNSSIGLPLTLLRLGPHVELVVAELGSNHPGEIDNLAKMAAPSVGLITNVGQTHLAFLRDKAGVAREKGALFRRLPEDGTAVVNLDDDLVADLATPARRFTYAFNRAADLAGRYSFRAQQPSLEIDGSLHIPLPRPALHFAQNALAAAAIGRLFEVPDEDISSALQSPALPPGRGELIRHDGITIINDSYNANLSSARAGLASLQEHPSAGHRIAVLGDMHELGLHAEEHHRLLGEAAAAMGVEELFCYGPESRATAAGAQAAGLPARHFCDKAELSSSLSAALNPGDVVYVKGSRAMAMESIIQELFGG